MPRRPPPKSGPRAGRLRLAIGMLIGGACVVAICVVVRNWMLNDSASADSPARSLGLPSAARSAPGEATPTATRAGARAPGRDPQPSPHAASPSDSSASSRLSQLRVFASVNGENVTREELAEECLRHYGEEVLEDLVNRYLVQQECRRRNISVTQAEVNAEIRRMTGKYKFSLDQWFKLLKEERGIDPKEYAEIVWRLLAIRKLAGDKLSVTQEELVKEFERQCGEAVKARIIVCDDRKTAEEVRAAAVASPDQFGKLAKEKSVDGPSASLNGLAPAIYKHVGPKEIEQAAFQMKDGEISGVIPVAGQYVILKREGLQPAMRVAFEQVKMQLMETIREEKSERAVHDVLRELQQQAEVVNVLNDPAKRQQVPGVAALVNGQQITIRQLAELCLERQGQQVLEGTINRRLLEQACRRQKITITQEDLDREIARAASKSLPLKPDGSPDVQRWIALKTRQQNISEKVYLNDEVWPSVALKKLVGEQVEVTEEDLRKGYEAHYGPQVRCLAIMLDDLHRAQRVWEMARQNPTKEFFGDLAEQYSMDPGGRGLRGEMRPIQKHGGMPTLEKEAFELQPNEISGIIHLGLNQYVILFCEGLTEPVDVEFETVRDEVYADIHETKLWAAMAKHFQEIQDRATIYNYLAGTVQSPKPSARARTAAQGSATQPSSLRR
jgi:parvulin-like peptidyl-prolyl isomerase